MKRLALITEVRVSATYSATFMIDGFPTIKSITKKQYEEWRGMMGGVQKIDSKKTVKPNGTVVTTYFLK